MPWFYVDDAFADSKPVMRLDDRLRNEAVGLWVRCGAWSAKEETDGHVPIDVVRQFGGTTRTVRALVSDAGLWDADNVENWRKNREILFKNWEKWQKTRAENDARRKADAARQANHRRNKKGRGFVAGIANTSTDSEMSRRDTPSDSIGDSKDVSRCESQRPDPDPYPSSTYVGTESSPNVGPTRDTERGLTEPINVSASRLVATLVPDKIPHSVRAALRIQASQLVNRDGLDTGVVAEALRRWLNKPGAGVGLLDHLAADVIREQTTRPGAGHINGLTAGEAKVVGWAALGKPPTPSTARKELEP
ncbi:hypothetical protein QEH38_gp80 [Mycobacterium phage LilSpotty]|uniref:Helix-turn-helix DNA binding domain protein n=1 Tax=Mycobacterium phage LilSpotty TaxID=2588512 RepID=A0A4Y6EMW8_9CAUD|nr:hypothetical protein QEH38_gp80 [Mycobacterium phage LilSpotty]AVP42381.1 hypothetical protein SEA_MISHA28_84 [Mycobacterium phage Misha28]AVP42469.1 hypothetical protein SEA_TOOTSIEPOP_84 [Mycobacterium phage TootsiePop]QDF19812.1 hypothetical protein SEA_LILSPOTTY_80 [Mycobacterium phage LilSpotty]QKO03267.1 helix-turn-helix DNA binding domain protein [Mycobacterium phage Awesomesauce]